MGHQHELNGRARWRRVGPAGRRGRWLTLGEGADIVLLGSPLAPAECYRPTAERLAAYGRAHLVEMPGCGRADRVSAPWSLHDYAAWAAGAIGAAGLARPAVIGHSYSGLVAVALAAGFPARCGALVVADAPAPGAPASLWQAVKGGVIDIALDLALVAAKWPHVAGNALSHPANFFSLLRESLQADVTGLARRVAAPALVAWGGRDHTTPPRAGEAYAACLPWARAYVSPRGTHTWAVSQPDELARAVAGFLAGLG